MSTHSRTKLVGAVAAVAALASWLLMPGPAVGATSPTFTVNFSSSTGSPLGGTGRGLLHGINKDFPDEANVAPLAPTEWRLGDPGYNGAAITPAYDYFDVYGTTAHYNPAQTEVITSDFIADPTYNPQYATPASTNWNTLCHNVAAAVVAAGQSPTFDLINEPNAGVDGATTSWLSTGSTSWDDCYAGVRSAAPTAQIAGPSISYSSVTDLETFLTDQNAKGKLPNVLTWHFDAPQTLASDASALRTWMTAHSIAQIPLVLQEALTSGSVGHPGQTVDYFAAAEEGNVTVGHACWSESGLPNGNTCEEPMLDGILNLTQTRRAEWYAYSDYAAMAGNAVSTTTSDITSVDGLATADSTTNKATVLLGANDGYGGGTVNVVLNGLGSLPFLSGATSVRVAVQTLSPGLGAASQPVTSDSTYTITSGSATVPVSLAKYSAARLTLTAVGSDLTDTSWSNLGGTLSDSPAIASTGSSNLFAFVRGSDGALYASRYNGSTWAAWSGSAWNNTTGAGDIGGPTSGTFVGAPSAVAWGGNVTVAVRGTDNALWIDTLSSAGTWGGWTSLGGTLASSPALASQNSSDLEAFARNTSGGVSTTQYNGTSWSAWASVGGAVIGDPTAVSRTSGEVTLYAKHADNSVWESYWTTAGGWSTWSSIGGNLSSSPNISAESSTQESLFGRSQSGALVRDTWTSTGWSGWATVGSGGPTYGVVTGTPATVSRGSGSTDVLVWSGDGPLEYLRTT